MRLMYLKRLGVLTGCVLGLVLVIGVVQAGAQGSTVVLKFADSGTQFSAVGFNANNPNAIPPVGATEIITIHLKNAVAQFGKPAGAVVGRVLIDCTVLVVNSPTDVDGVCTAIAHVPNGYFTFGGSGAFNNSRVNYWDITGGVGPYENDRGQIKVVNSANGGSAATVTLTS
jgi:hypothetical protein